VASVFGVASGANRVILQTSSIRSYLASAKTTNSFLLKNLQNLNCLWQTVPVRNIQALSERHFAKFSD